MESKSIKTALYDLFDRECVTPQDFLTLSEMADEEWSDIIEAANELVAKDGGVVDITELRNTNEPFYSVILSLREIAGEVADLCIDTPLIPDWATEVYFENQARSTYDVKWDEWPFNQIDWTAAAREALIDYQSFSVTRPDGIVTVYYYE